jgi:hypothetical protein
MAHLNRLGKALPVILLSDDYNAEIVRDEQHRHAVVPLQRLQQLQDLRLHGDVERGRRLVGDQQFRTVRERHRDHHPLALAAGKLVREGPETFFRLADADFVQERTLIDTVVDPDPEAQRVSRGCIRLTNEAARTLMYMVDVGTPVLVF